MGFSRQEYWSGEPFIAFSDQRNNSSIDKLFNRNSRKRSTWQLNMFKVLKALMFLILGKLSIRKEDSKIDIFKTKF